MTIASDTKTPPEDGADTERKTGLLDNFVRRTDNDFHGVTDKSLIGEDLAEEEFDEDGEPIER